MTTADRDLSRIADALERIADRLDGGPAKRRPGAPLSAISARTLAAQNAPVSRHRRQVLDGLVQRLYARKDHALTSAVWEALGSAEDVDGVPDKDFDQVAALLLTIDAQTRTHDRHHCDRKEQD